MRAVRMAFIGALWLAVAGSLNARTDTPAQDQRPADANTLLYADFEKLENNRPVSARGGLIELYGYEESRVHKSTFKGLEGAEPPAPELVRIKKDDPNLAMKFDYSLRAPNQWAGVTVEIHGLPDANGRPVPEDVSGFKTLSLQVYATGIQICASRPSAANEARTWGRSTPR